MSHAGLDISDDAIHCIEYRLTTKGFIISKFSREELPSGVIVEGDIKDEKVFAEILKGFAKKNGLGYVKVSLPEEKTYLFQTDVPDGRMRTIAQNIEFKLDQNVPLPAAEVVFYFDMLPTYPEAPAPRATVSVVSRNYLDQYISLLTGANMTPVSFEVVPKSIVRAVVPPESKENHLIIHRMKRKVGLYIVSGNAVFFTSTINLSDPAADPVAVLSNEINRVFSYWTSRPDAHGSISRVLLVGQGALDFEAELRAKGGQMSIAAVADIWRNIIDINTYIPPIPYSQALEYVVAAGLALPLK